MFDLLGPLLASISLLVTWIDVTEDKYEATDAWGDNLVRVRLRAKAKPKPKPKPEPNFSNPTLTLTR